MSNSQQPPRSSNGRAVENAARAILEPFRRMLDAEGGFVVIGAPGAAAVEPLLLGSGRYHSGSEASLALSVRWLGDRARATGRAELVNDLNCADTRNALVAPIIIAGEVAGLLGLTDKPGGFSLADARLAALFAETIAVALRNSRSIDGLERNRRVLEAEVRKGAKRLRQAEERYRTLVANLPDVVVRFDSDLRHRYVSPNIEPITGRPAHEFLGKTNRELGMAPELEVKWDAALTRVFATGEPERLDCSHATAAGIRYFDCRLVPETGSGGEIPFVLTVARDVTDRWRTEEAERRARSIADTLREATVALTRSLDRETVLTTLLDWLRRMVPFDRAAILVLEEPLRVSVRAVFDGDRVVPLPAAGRPQLAVPDHPILLEILTTGTAVLVPDVAARSDWSLPIDLAVEASWLGVPLFARGDVIGMFSLSKTEAGYFGEEHLELAEAMSSQASVAVENALLFEQMQASTARMQALSRRLVEMQEDERRSIARELHDEAGQALVSLRFGLRQLERESGQGLSVTQRVAELVQSTDSLIEGLHRLGADLRPVSLEHLGLEAALRQFVMSRGSEMGITARFKARDLAGRRLAVAVETALYRVTQESLTNVGRHAHATCVDVLAERRGERVFLMIEDDGVGFDTSRVLGGDHLGLIGMRERAEALGGTLAVESAPGSGTTIVVEVPCADPHPDR